MKLPKLGHHFELCFTVKDMKKSIEFYENIGFKIYTGGADKEWCTVTDGLVYLAMFPKEGALPEMKFGFNFRGGNIKKLVPALKAKGVDFFEEKVLDGGTGGAKFYDPDGNLIYLDTADFEDRIDVEE